MIGIDWRQISTKTMVGFEPTLFRFEIYCLIHWATWSYLFHRQLIDNINKKSIDVPTRLWLKLFFVRKSP